MKTPGTIGITPGTLNTAGGTFMRCERNSAIPATTTAAAKVAIAICNSPPNGPISNKRDPTPAAPQNAHKANTLRGTLKSMANPVAASAAMTEA
ncbi:MAG: hypothetical protein WC360_06185 [Opitutales bacterium]